MSIKSKQYDLHRDHHQDDFNLVGCMASTLATLASSSPRSLPSKINLSPPVLQTSTWRGRSMDPVTNRLSLEDRTGWIRPRSNVLFHDAPWWMPWGPEWCEPTTSVVVMPHLSRNYQHFKSDIFATTEKGPIYHQWGVKPERLVEDWLLLSVCCKALACHHWPVSPLEPQMMRIGRR